MEVYGMEQNRLLPNHDCVHWIPNGESPHNTNDTKDSPDACYNTVLTLIVYILDNLEASSGYN